MLIIHHMSAAALEALFAAFAMPAQDGDVLRWQAPAWWHTAAQASPHAAELERFVSAQYED
jgi:hypothetical protein